MTETKDLRPALTRMGISWRASSALSSFVTVVSFRGVEWTVTEFRRHDERTGKMEPAFLVKARVASGAVSDVLAAMGVRASLARRVPVFNHETDCATGHTVCSACLEAIDPSDRFCRHCGATLGG